MDSGFLTRFSHTQRNQAKSYNLAGGIPINKNLSPRQLHKGNSLSSAAQSVLNSNLPKEMLKKPTISTNSQSFRLPAVPYSYYTEPGSPESAAQLIAHPRKTIPPVKGLFSGLSNETITSGHIKNRSIGFSQDHKVYYTLGGLGPNLGTSVWNLAKRRSDRIREYSRLVRDFHSLT